MDNKNDIYVVGMRVEKRIGVTSAEEAFDTECCNSEKYILFCNVHINKYYQRKFTITLYEDYGWCGSGYTTASFGYMEIDEVKDFGTATHRPKNGKPVKLEQAYFDPSKIGIDKGFVFEPSTDHYSYCEIANNVFDYSSDGNDSYYPCGFVNVHVDLFEEYKRSFDGERPVWIFFGESATGKSTLAYYLNNTKTVFETDSLKEGKLLDTIWADIIVVGNKYAIDMKNLLLHLPQGVKPIYVYFAKE